MKMPMSLSVIASHSKSEVIARLRLFFSFSFCFYGLNFSLNIYSNDFHGQCMCIVYANIIRHIALPYKKNIFRWLFLFRFSFLCITYEQDIGDHSQLVNPNFALTLVIVWHLPFGIVSPWNLSQNSASNNNNNHRLYLLLIKRHNFRIYICHCPLVSYSLESKFIASK